MTSELFKRIEAVLPTLHGWCDLEKATCLAASVIAIRPAVVVEIGVFGGKSLAPLAMACEAVNFGQVFAIDPWDMECSVEGYDAANREWWANLNHDQIYQFFRIALRDLNLESRVTIIREKSDDVTPPDIIHMLHVDGQHSEQAIRDVKRYAANVSIGGLTAVDDTHWTNNGVPHVSMAVEELLKLGFVHLYDVGTGAMFQRVSK